jgi:hypothetical protein
MKIKREEELQIKNGILMEEKKRRKLIYPFQIIKKGGEFIRIGGGKKDNIGLNNMNLILKQIGRRYEGIGRLRMENFIQLLIMNEGV